MKSRKWLCLLLAMSFAAVSCAQEKAFTGADYLKLGKPQRVQVVKQYKENAKKDGVTITKDNIFYCRSLDAFYAKHPDMQKENFNGIMKTLAIMQYDWDKKGVDKDALAKQWLGDDLYRANKSRLSKK